MEKEERKRDKPGRKRQYDDELHEYWRQAAMKAYDKKKKKKQNKIDTEEVKRYD